MNTLHISNQIKSNQLFSLIIGDIIDASVPRGHTTGQLQRVLQDRTLMVSKLPYWTVTV